MTAGEQLIEKGRAEGRTEGQGRLLLRQLRIRFGKTTSEVDARVAGATVAELDTWGERVLTASTLDEVFAE